MSRFAFAPLAGAVLIPLFLSTAIPQGRSFVGKKLAGRVTFVDTEGHTINPSHYLGSVLVMIGGIPW